MVITIPDDPSPARKLALAFHPDKNKAPGAGEAFKAIGDNGGILTFDDQ